MNCTMGVGCDESGVCYAAAQGQPEQCPKHDPECAKCGQNYGLHVAGCRWMTCRPARQRSSKHGGQQ